MSHCTHTGAKVSFKLGQIVCPDRDDLFLNLTDELELTGTISFVSDNGRDDGQYAIVEVPGLSAPVIVPAEKLCDRLNDVPAQPVQSRGMVVYVRQGTLSTS